MIGWIAIAPSSPDSEHSDHSVFSTHLHFAWPAVYNSLIERFTSTYTVLLTNPRHFSVASVGWRHRPCSVSAGKTEVDNQDQVDQKQNLN